MAMARSTSTSGAPTQRQLRVGERVRHVLAEILARGEVYDPDLARHVITVPEVRMSPDLKLATVLIMPLGGRDAETVLGALGRNAKGLRQALARQVSDLRAVPDLRFRLDDRYDEARRVERLFDDPKVQRDLARPDVHKPEPT